MARPSAFISLSALFFARLWSFAYAQSGNSTDPVASPFYSRPDITPPVLNITLRNDSLISPGYLFLAPYQIAQPGPYLYDTSGNLVWSGYGVGGPSASHDFHICQYNGADHLCMYQGNQLLGYARGHGIILDNTLTTVKTVQTGAGRPPADQHEFNVINDGKSALMTIFRPVPYDLTDYNVTGGQGFVVEGIMQEVDTSNSQVLFEWRSLDHVKPSAGYVLPNTTDVSGDGKSMSTAWDYFHINAVDKNAEGDYLVSARHTETIYKISGTNGSVIWQLGGKNSSFQMQGFNFSYQHDCRFVSENSTTTIISLFDNAYNGFNSSSEISAGKLIAVNNSTMNATLLTEYVASNTFLDGAPGLHSASQGNMQYLPNGNAFIGWGSNAVVSEFTADGTNVFNAWFATTGALHYRAYKFNFTSNPSDQPALYTYALNSTSGTTYYVSWNGATEVDSWTFYSGASPDTLTQVGNTKKNGFETVASQATFYAYTIAEAVARDGSKLRNSTLTSTFVPGSTLALSCNSIQCPMIGGFSVEPQVFGLTSAPTPPQKAVSTTAPVPISSSATGAVPDTPDQVCKKSAAATWAGVPLVSLVAMMAVALIMVLR